MPTCPPQRDTRTGKLDLDRKLGPPEAVLQHIVGDSDVIVPIANGEPTAVMDAIEAAALDLHAVRIHQMHPLHDRPYLHDAFPGHLRHVSYFLSHVTRGPYAKGNVDLIPAHFSEVPLLLKRMARFPLVIAAASRPDRHGYFSLGMNADYVSEFIGKVPFFLEVTRDMPRTFGRNQIHISQLVGYAESDRPLVEVQAPVVSEKDRRIAAPSWPNESRTARPSRRESAPFPMRFSRCSPTVAISAFTPSS